MRFLRKLLSTLLSASVERLRARGELVGSRASGGELNTLPAHKIESVFGLAQQLPSRRLCEYPSELNDIQAWDASL